MKSIQKASTAALPAFLLLALAACEAEKSSNPLSPSIAGPIPGVEITAPRPVEPGQGVRLRETQQPIRLLVENASTNGVRPLSYTFEVASDSAFQTKMYARSGVNPGDGGRTSVQIDRLELGRTYYWRARAEDGANTGPFVTIQFEMLPRAFLGIPGPRSPVGGATTPTRRPTLIVRNAERNAAVGNVRYEFQVARDQAFGSVVSAGVADEGSGETSFTTVNELSADDPFLWRARASDGETMSDWSQPQAFRTPRAGAPSPSPGPGRAACGPPYPSNGPAVVACVAASYPDRLVAGVSHNQRVANMEFLRDRVIEVGICGGMDLAWNRKRGTGPHSSDAIAWRVNGRDEVVDIGIAFDDTSIPLALTWGIVEGPAGYDPYPRPSCQ